MSDNHAENAPDESIPEDQVSRIEDLGYDEQTRRMLREVELTAEYAVMKDHVNRVNAELISKVEEQIATEGEPDDLVDMTPLLEFFARSGIVTTHFGGGGKLEGFSLNQPRIMFPHLGDIERVLQLFEALARHAGDADIVAAIHKHATDIGKVYEADDALTSGEGGAFIGGRVVSLDNTWSVEIDSVEYEDFWVRGLKDFERPVPEQRPVGDLAWRLTVHFPVRHAEVLNRAAAELLAG
jgi:hypothetical protein